MQPSGAASVSTGSSGEAAAANAKRRQGMLLASPGALYLLIFFVVSACPDLGLLLRHPHLHRPDVAQRLERRVLPGYRRRRHCGHYRAIGVAGHAHHCAVPGGRLPLRLLHSDPRPRHLRAVLLVLVMIPFWTNGLVTGLRYPFPARIERTGLDAQREPGLRDVPAPVHADCGDHRDGLQLPHADGAAAVRSPRAHGLEPRRGSRDLYASGSKAFWKVTLPLTKSGIVAGSVLVFVPSFGSYVVPDILGGPRRC